MRFKFIAALATFLRRSIIVICKKYAYCLSGFKNAQLRGITFVNINQSTESRRY